MCISNESENAIRNGDDFKPEYEFYSLLCKEETKIQSNPQ